MQTEYFMIPVTAGISWNHQLNCDNVAKRKLLYLILLLLGMNYYEAVSLIFLSFALLSLVFGLFASEIFTLSGNQIFYTATGLFLIMMILSLAYYGFGTRR